MVSGSGAFVLANLPVMMEQKNPNRRAERRSASGIQLPALREMRGAVWLGTPYLSMSGQVGNEDCANDT